MLLRNLTCVNCGALIKDSEYFDFNDKAGLTYYSDSECVGPTYFIAKQVKGAGYFDITEDLCLCSPSCGVEYDKTKNSRI